MEKIFHRATGWRCSLSFLLFLGIFPFRLLPQAAHFSSENLETIFARKQNPDSATTAFYAALEKLRAGSPSVASNMERLYTDIIDIIDDTERARWKTLRTPEEKITFLKHFWLGHDLTPATMVNERLVEHYQRLIYARDKFGYFGARGYDDRGIVYVQYGPPDDYVDEALNANATPLTSWVYHRYGVPVNFDFIDEGFGYRLNTNLREAARTFSAATEVQAVRGILERRRDLHMAYTRLLMELDTNIPDPLLLDRALSAYRIETANHQARLPRTASEVFTRVEELACTLALAQFQSDAGKTVLLAMYGFNLVELKQKADTTRVQIVSAIRDTTLAWRARRDTTYNFFSRTSEKSEWFVAAETYHLPLNKYFFLLDINHVTGRQRALRDFALTLAKYPAGILHLSNTIFATEIVAANDSLANPGLFPIKPIDLGLRIFDLGLFRRHHLAITPYPFSALKREQRMFIYFEIYDLQREANGETSYEVQYEIKAPEKKGLFASLNPFGKSGGSISVSDTRRGHAATEPTYLQLDFSQLRGGKYDLIVRVTDKLAKITKESRLAFELE